MGRDLQFHPRVEDHDRGDALRVDDLERDFVADGQPGGLAVPHREPGVGEEPGFVLLEERVEDRGDRRRAHADRELAGRRLRSRAVDRERGRGLPRHPEIGDDLARDLRHGRLDHHLRRRGVDLAQQGIDDPHLRGGRRQDEDVGGLVHLGRLDDGVGQARAQQVQEHARIDIVRRDDARRREFGRQVDLGDERRDLGVIRLRRVDEDRVVGLVHRHLLPLEPGDREDGGHQIFPGDVDQGVPPDHGLHHPVFPPHDDGAADGHGPQVVRLQDEPEGLLEGHPGQLDGDPAPHRRVGHDVGMGQLRQGRQHVDDLHVPHLEGDGPGRTRSPRDPLRQSGGRRARAGRRRAGRRGDADHDRASFGRGA